MPVRVPDVLLRVGGRTLLRHGVLASAGAGRVEVAHTFARADASTCATYIDRSGLVRLAAANVPRIEWVDLDGDGVRETPGILLEGAGANRVTYSDDFSNWTQILTPTRVGGTIDLGEIDLSELGDNNATSGQIEGFRLTGTFAGAGATPFSIVVEKSATPAATAARVQVFDTTAGAMRLEFDITWSGTTPVVTIIGSVGTYLGNQKLSNRDSYRLLFQTTSGVVDTNASRIDIYPAFGDTDTGTIHAGGVMLGARSVSSLSTPSSHIKTTGAVVQRAADSLTLPFNFGPMDLTILARLARPVHADFVGSIGVHLGIYKLSTALEMFFASATRVIGSDVNGAGSSGISAAIPAGATITPCAQYTGFPGGAKTRLDVGLGFGSFSSTQVINAFADQVLTVGLSQEGGSDKLYGVLVDLIIARGLFTRDEMLAIP